VTVTAKRRQLTDEQYRAITARGVSVALSAGAGCGKTFVLTERFLVELEPTKKGPAKEGPGSFCRNGPKGASHKMNLVPFSRVPFFTLVAITFTERAAREMRERIRAACEARLLGCPEEQGDYWLELVRELDSARITTIHSFCGSLLRSHAVEAGLDPRFGVLDQGQADTLLSELIDEQLRERLAEHDGPLIDLVVEFGISGLKDRIAVLLRRRHEVDWAAWTEETPEGLVARWERFARDVALPVAAGELAASPAAREVLDIARARPSSNATMLGRFELLAEKLPGLAESRDPLADLAAINEAARVVGGGGKKAWAETKKGTGLICRNGPEGASHKLAPSPFSYERFKSACEQLRKGIKGTQKLAEFDAEAARPAAETVLRLLALTGQVAAAYQAHKRELGLLDFDDLLIHARDLLVGPKREALRRQLAAQIHLLLVDEFQDTDPLQVELVEALCDGAVTGGKLFLVGDHKQSIYRFRGADPRVFQRLRQTIPERGRLPLTLNFRSQPAVLAFVNALFADELGPEYEPLRPYRPQVTPLPAVEFLWAPVETEGGKKPSENELRAREADWIARRIRAMLEAGEPIVLDEGTLETDTPSARPVRAGDVALLFRALSNVELYEEALRRYGIDYYLVGGHAFYAQQEIYDLVNLLRALASEADELSLAGVLRSPFFNLHDETLFWLAQHPEGLGAGLMAEAPPAELDDEQRRRVRFAAATLRELRAMKDRLPVARLIQEALARTGYDAVLLGEFLGERKLANLHKLVDQARGFDRSGVFTLDDFITQLSEFVARQPDEPLAATCPESTDVVRLMTIHQSKGLEFPVVFVPDLGRKPRGTTATVAFTPELGPMLKKADVVTGFDLYRAVEVAEDRAETNRLLYVATTRAADYLVLSAGVPELGVARGPWMGLVERHFDLTTGEPRDGAAQDVRVKVTTAEPPLSGARSGGEAPRQLKKMVEKARDTAGKGAGRVPPHLAPVPPDTGARQQFSFSRLAGVLHRHDAGLAAEPIDAGAPGPPLLDPLGLGSLVHAVLDELDFAKCLSEKGSDPLNRGGLTPFRIGSRPEQIAELVERHAQRHLADGGEVVRGLSQFSRSGGLSQFSRSENGTVPFGSREELAEAIAMIERFAASPRAAELAAAAEVYRELEFLLPWPPGTGKPQEKYVQGFIDCLYRDASGAWHLIDYKTNRVTPKTLAATAARYEMQMLVYALAAERTLGSPPAELALCFLRTGDEHLFPWDDAARARVIEMVDRAIHKTATGGRAP